MKAAKIAASAQPSSGPPWSWEHLEPSDTTSRCHWKGTASYYDLEVRGERKSDAAWEYRDPSEAARMVKDRIGFWHGVEVVE